MRMEGEVARPGVQHRRDAELRALWAEALWARRELRERVRRGAEEQREEHAAVALDVTTKLAREREDHVEVMHREQACEASVEPALAREALALGTVTVAA